MTFEEIKKNIKDVDNPVMDFEDFYNEMTKGNPLFFKDYYLTIYKDHIRLRSLKEYKDTFTGK